MSKDYQNLFLLFKMFKNRPNHLVNYLLENKALTRDFLKRVESNDKLSKFYDSDIDDGNFYFTDISEMKSYFASLVGDINIEDSENRERMKEELKQILNKAIMDEDYEEAARIRDFIKLNNLKN